MNARRRATCTRRVQLRKIDIVEVEDIIVMRARSGGPIELNSSSDSASLIKYILTCPQLNIVQFAKFEATAQFRKLGSGKP